MPRIGRLEVKVNMFIEEGDEIIFRNGKKGIVRDVEIDNNDESHPFKVRFRVEGDNDARWFTQKGTIHADPDNQDEMDIVETKRPISDD